jgi:hypothetical protein
MYHIANSCFFRIQKTSRARTALLYAESTDRWPGRFPKSLDWRSGAVASQRTNCNPQHAISHDLPPSSGRFCQHGRAIGPEFLCPKQTWHARPPARRKLSFVHQCPESLFTARQDLTNKGSTAAIARLEQKTRENGMRAAVRGFRAMDGSQCFSAIPW